MAPELPDGLYRWIVSVGGTQIVCVPRESAASLKLLGK
jgi:hypothetical protein